jgi:hypothetical protein
LGHTRDIADVNLDDKDASKPAKRLMVPENNMAIVWFLLCGPLPVAIPALKALVALPFNTSKSARPVTADRFRLFCFCHRYAIMPHLAPVKEMIASV